MHKLEREPGAECKCRSFFIRAAMGELGGDGPLRLEMGFPGVAAPPPRGTLTKLKIRFKETFFPDDPFRQFKGQSLGAKWALAAQYVFPILHWAPKYSLSLFKSDLVAGLTIASLAIPQVRASLLLHRRRQRHYCTS